MKIIIDIDEGTYKNVKNFYDNLGEYEVIGEYECAIAEGIPLEEKDDCDSCKFNSRPSYAKPCCNCYMNQEVVENHFIRKENKE